MLPYKRWFYLAFALVFLIGACTGGIVMSVRDGVKTDQQVNAVIEEADKEKAVNEGLLDRVVVLEGEAASLRRQNEEQNKQLSEAAEASRAAKVRASRSRRVAAAPASAHVTSSPGGWATSVRGNKIANCESADLMHWPYSDGSRYLGGERGVHLHDQATYTGKWQIGPNEWRDWGGLKFASAPYLATEAEQDIVANNGYAARGEQPWVCARKV